MVEVADGGVVAFFVVVIICYIFGWCYFCRGCRTVNQSQVMIIERFGRYSRTLTPGLHWTWPYIEAPRLIDWRHLHVNEYSRTPCVHQSITEYIDLREHVLDFPSREVITKDTVQIKIDALVYFRITDPRASVYHIQNLPDALEMLTVSTLRNIVAGLTLDETFSSRDYVNTMLLQQIERDVTRWGISVTRLAIEDIIMPSDIREAMESQIQEERDRRSTVIRAGGQRESDIIRSKGDAATMILAAEGVKAGDVARAKGQALARVIAAEADSECFQYIQDALSGRYKAADYLYSLEYLQTWPSLSGPKTEVDLIPEAAYSKLCKKSQ